MAMKNCYIHPNALVETIDIGEGTRIWAFAHVMRDVSIGQNCNIGDHAFLESGVVVGNGVTIKNNAMLWKGVELADYVFVGPGVIFTNDLYPRSPRLPDAQDRYLAEKQWLMKTFVEEGVTIGANSTIICGILLGRYCTVAAGSVVTKDVPSFSLVAGNPARIIGAVNKEGRVLKQKGEEWVHVSTGNRYRLVQGEMRPIVKKNKKGRE